MSDDLFNESIDFKSLLSEKVKKQIQVKDETINELLEGKEILEAEIRKLKHEINILNKKLVSVAPKIASLDSIRKRVLDIKTSKLDSIEKKRELFNFYGLIFDYVYNIPKSDTVKTNCVFNEAGVHQFLQYLYYDNRDEIIVLFNIIEKQYSPIQKLHFSEFYSEDELVRLFSKRRSIKNVSTIFKEKINDYELCFSSLKYNSLVGTETVFSQILSYLETGKKPFSDDDLLLITLIKSTNTTKEQKKKLVNILISYKNNGVNINYDDELITILLELGEKEFVYPLLEIKMHSRLSFGKFIGADEFDDFADFIKTTKSDELVNMIKYATEYKVLTVLVNNWVKKNL